MCSPVVFAVDGVVIRGATVTDISSNLIPSNTIDLFSPALLLFAGSDGDTT